MDSSQAACIAVEVKSRGSLMRGRVPRQRGRAYRQTGVCGDLESKPPDPQERGIGSEARLGLAVLGLFLSSLGLLTYLVVTAIREL